MSEPTPNLPAPRPAEMQGEESSYAARWLRCVLRGRWRWLAAVAVPLAAAGAAGGYLLAEPRYESVGLIQVRPIMPRILYETEQSDELPLFDAFLRSQATMLASRRVIDNAMNHEDWEAGGFGRSPADAAQFSRSLAVMHPTNTQLVRVTFEHPDPATASLAVRLVIDAYMRLFVEQDLQYDNERLTVLENLRAELNNRLTSLRNQVHAIASEHGTDDLRSLYTFRLQQLQKTETALIDLNLALAQTPPPSGDPAEPERPAELGVEQLSLLDDRLYRYLEERRVLEAQLAVHARRFGERHKATERLRLGLDQVDQTIADYVADFRALSEQGLIAGPVHPEQTHRRLAQRRDELEQIRAELESQTMALGRKMLEIDLLRGEMTTLGERLDEAKLRIEQLVIESNTGAQHGRVSVVEPGSVPLEPSSDPRRKTSAAGAAAGLTAALGLFVALGVFDRRVRFSDEAVLAVGGLPVLGVLPDLARDADEQQALEAAETAARIVHRLRGRLQVQFAGVACPVVSVTSAAAGSGKTSLAIGLGLSYAAAGARTLLIDADLVGRGLTQRSGSIARRRLGRILLGQGKLSEGGLDEALGRTRERGYGRPLGEVLVEAGLAENQDVSDALMLQSRESLGLLDALGGAALGDCVAALGPSNLHVLPVGGATRAHAVRVAPGSLRRVLDQARGAYDVVLIDTGPVSGSLEAIHVAAQSDRVVLVAARGESRGAVRESVEQLRAVGVGLAGLVFNRAAQSEVLVGSSDSMYASSSMPSRSQAGTPRFGAVADAVAMTVPDPSREQPAAARVSGA